MTSLDFLIELYAAWSPKGVLASVAMVMQLSVLHLIPKMFSSGNRAQDQYVYNHALVGGPQDENVL